MERRIVLLQERGLAVDGEIVGLQRRRRNRFVGGRRQVVIEAVVQTGAQFASVKSESKRCAPAGNMTLRLP